MFQLPSRNGGGGVEIWLIIIEHALNTSKGDPNESLTIDLTSRLQTLGAKKDCCLPEMHLIMTASSEHHMKLDDEARLWRGCGA